MKKILIIAAVYLFVISNAQAHSLNLPAATALSVPTAQKVSLTGTLEVLHHDDFENPQNSHDDFFLRTADGQKISLNLTSPISAAPGATISITGTRSGSTLTADGTTSRLLTAAPALDSMGEQKMLVVLVNFLNSDPVPASAARMHDRIFNGPFQKYYQEQSYGKVHFSGDVRGWYTLPWNVNCDLSPATRPALSDVKPFLLADGVNSLGGYDRLVFIANHSCFGGGRSGVGKSVGTFNGLSYNLSISDMGVTSATWPLKSTYRGSIDFTSFDFVLAHEIGHGLGLDHSKGLDCGAVAFSQNCQEIEYGNHFDVMGWGFYATHFNAFHKEELGWLTPDEVINIIKTGRYTLTPLEIKKQTGDKKLAKITPLGANSPALTLEYRKAVGFDSELNFPELAANQNGLMINSLRSWPWGDGFFTRLLDLRPSTQYWDSDLLETTLNLNEGTFSDQASGVTIGPVVSASDESITFDVSLAKQQCGRGPRLTLTPQYPYSSYRGRFHLDLSNADASGCAPSGFEVRINGAYFQALNPIPTGSSYRFSLNTADYSPGTVPGSYAISIVGKNLSSGGETNYPFSYLVPIIDSISQTTARSGGPLTLTGKFFDSSSRVRFCQGSCGLGSPLIPTSADYVGEVDTLNLTVPSLSNGTYSVEVWNNSGSYRSNQKSVTINNSNASASISAQLANTVAGIQELLNKLRELVRN